jgi:hypothetical protein
MRQIKINSTTGNEIVSIADVKDYARIDTEADNNIISQMIVQARIWCENFISKDIVSKNRTYYLPETNGTFDLPFAPVSEIQSITIGGTSTTDYEILGVDNETIELDGGSAENVKITYITLGMNDALLKQAMLQLIATYYDNRAEFVKGSISEIPTNVKNILSGYKSMWV